VQENLLPSTRTALFCSVLFVSAFFFTISAANLNAQTQTPRDQTQQQKQSVQVLDAGGGNKQELIRNAAGDVIENRIYDEHGKLDSVYRTNYIPGRYAPDTDVVSFYPDGKTVKATAKVAYDASANFLSETTERFDQSGKHTEGHKLLHDPVNGMFRCWKWNPNSQKYDRVVCPSGEESGEKAPPFKPIGQDEAEKMLGAARTAAAAQQKSERMTPAHMVTPPVASKDTKFSIVLPAALAPGKQVSGSVVEDASLFRLRPDLIVQEVTLSVNDDAAKLANWRIEIAGAQPQRADTSFTFTVPSGASEITLKLYAEGDPAHAVTRSIPVSKPAPGNSKPKPGYFAQALCVAGDVCPISGSFSGNATNSFAAFGDKPALIAAETNDMVYVKVPDNLLMEQQLLFTEANELIVFPVAVAQIDVVVDGRQLDDFQQGVSPGDKKLVFAGIISVQSLPDESWQAGMISKANLEWARRFVPGFEVPKESHAEREEREMMEKMEQQQKGVKEPKKEKEEKLGSIVYFLKNTTPDVGSWRGSKDQTFALPLNPESFSQGDFRYKFVVEASKAGTYGMDVALIPFVAPVQGQKFTLPSATAAK
jgi:hypothetical protein